MKKAAKNGGRKAPAAESRHGKIREGSSRRLLQGSAEQWAAWDAAAERAELSFNEWARAVLDTEARKAAR